MMPNPVGLADALFSKVQQRVLALVFGHPGQSFYTSEIVRRLRSGTGAVERELSKLERSGLVSVRRVGNQKHYQANRAAPVFKELRSLVEKAMGVAEPLRCALEPHAQTIDVAFVFGSVAKQTDTAQSDIDLMVIGDELDYSGLYAATEQAERRLRRKVNPLFLSRRDWRRKSSDTGSVVHRIGNAPKLFIIGSEKDLSAWANRNSTTS
jgi:predicted nucleotidyltransferase